MSCNGAGKGDCVCACVCARASVRTYKYCLFCTCHASAILHTHCRIRSSEHTWGRTSWHRNPTGSKMSSARRWCRTARWGNCNCRCHSQGPAAASRRGRSLAATIPPTAQKARETGTQQPDCASGCRRAPSTGTRKLGGARALRLRPWLHS